MSNEDFTTQRAHGGNCRGAGFLVHRRPVIFAAGMNLKAAFETGEAAAVAVVFEALPRIEAAQINIAEDHAAEVGQVRDAALAGRDRGIEGDGADDPDEVFHLDRKEKIKIDYAVGIDQTVSE